MRKYKLSAFLSLLLVFLSGAVVGALALRLYMVNTVYTFGSAAIPPQPKHPTPEEVRHQIIIDLKSKLHLDDQEVTALNSIMDETRDGFRKLRDRINAEGHVFHDQQWQKFRAMLRPDQQVLYDEWRAQRDAEMHKRREQQQQHPAAGAPSHP